MIHFSTVIVIILLGLNKICSSDQIKRLDLYTLKKWVFNVFDD